MESSQHNERKIISMATLDQHVKRRRTVERTKICVNCGDSVTKSRHSIPVLCDRCRAYERAKRYIEDHAPTDEGQAEAGIEEANHFMFETLAAVVDGIEPPEPPASTPEPMPGGHPDIGNQSSLSLRQPGMTGRLAYLPPTGNANIDMLLRDRTDLLNDYESYLDIENDAHRMRAKIWAEYQEITSILKEQGWPS